MRFRTAIRLGAAAALALPMCVFLCRYFLGGGSMASLPALLISGAIEGAIELINYFFANPMMATVYLIVLFAVGRVAFGVRRQGR